MAKIDQDTHKGLFETIGQEQDPQFNTNRKIRAKRLSVSFSVQVTINGSPVSGWAEAQNISFSGMLLLTNFSLNLRDECTLEFTLPDHDIPLQAKVRIVRVTQGQVVDEPVTMAVAFINTDPNVAKILSGFVLEHLPI